MQAETTTRSVDYLVEFTDDASQPVTPDTRGIILPPPSTGTQERGPPDSPPGEEPPQ